MYFWYYLQFFILTLKSSQAKIVIYRNVYILGEILFILESIISKLATSETFQARLCSLIDWFEFRYVGNPEDRFCGVDVHITTFVWLIWL